MCLWEFKLWILKSLSISCVRCCSFDFIRHKMDLEMDSLPSPARRRDSRSLTGWEPSGAFWVSHWGRAELTPPQKEGLAASVRTQGTHFCEDMTSKYKKKNEQESRRKRFCVPNLTHVIRKRFQKLAFYFVCFYGKENGENEDHAGRAARPNWLLVDGGSENKTIASQVTKATPNNDDWRTDNSWDISRYFWSFCASLKSTDTMVSVSMTWPGLLAALILIVYCINMRKKKQYQWLWWW